MVVPKTGFPAVNGIAQYIEDNGLLQDWTSMTAATEAVYGTSGRGNPGCKEKLRYLARIGWLEVSKRGRIELLRRRP